MKNFFEIRPSLIYLLYYLNLKFGVSFYYVQSNLAIFNKFEIVYGVFMEDIISN